MNYGKTLFLFCVLAFIYLICVISSGNDEIYRYEETSSIDIDNSTEDEVGKVEISDTYTKMVLNISKLLLLWMVKIKNLHFLKKSMINT